MAFFSTSSADYASAISSLVKPTYTSKYNDTISNIMDKIANREDFSYDFNADPLYQNYKDNYTKLGNEAAMNAAAAVSTQTGGYGNSYAATAASQANQQYLTQLNNVIPELYSAAMNKYQMETEDLYNQFDMYETEENRQYGQYRDSVSDYYSDWSNLLSGFSAAQAQENADREYNYQVSRDAVSDAQWKASYDSSNSQWQKEFDESKRQWQAEYDLALQQAKAKASGSSGGGSSKSSYGTGLSSSYDKYYERAMQYANDLSSSTKIDTVNKYLDQMIKSNNLTSSQAQKIYNAVLSNNSKYANFASSLN